MSARVTWWGHATVLVEDRARVLTDPALTAPLGYLRRRAGIVPDPELLRPDVVAISHLHGDHLHVASLRRLPRGTPVIVPRGAGPLLSGLELEVLGVIAGEHVEVGGVRVTAVPARHDGGRSRFSRVRGVALGYVVEGSIRTYFAGDTGLFDGMADLGTVDLALLPVAGWGPTLGGGGGHLDPRQAAQALDLLRPTVALPIHYGTFWPRGLSWLRPERFWLPGERFAEHAQEVCPDVDIRVLPPATSTFVDI